MLNKKIKYRKYLWVICLIILFFIPLLDLFHPGLPVTNDGQDHVVRIANFYHSLSEGNIIPRWAGNLNWGYGHPILMFLYPIPSYTASLFHFLGFTLVDSVKIVFGVAFIASGLTMYLWVKSFLGQKAGIVSGLFYMFAPYRFIDLYVRGAIGEHVAFIFPPLILYFLLKSAKKSSYWHIVGGGLSLCGLILSHNAISLMFLPIIGLYAFYLYFQTKIKKEFLFTVVSIVFFGFSLAAFFWVPALLEGKYTLRDKVIAGEYTSRFIPFANFFRDPPGYDGNTPFSMRVGTIQWIVVLLSTPFTYVLYRRKKPIWIISFVSLCIFAISLFLITSASRGIWERIFLLQNFQFPWRFLSVTVFAIALLGGILLYQLPKKIMTFTILLIAAGLIFSTSTMWDIHKFLYKPEKFFASVYDGTTDTGESAPIWSVRFMERRPKANIEIIQGKGEIKEIKRTSTKHAYIALANEEVRISENTLFFPGWEVFVNGKIVPLQFQDPQYRGIMTFFAPKGKNTIDVVFRETKLRTIANNVSLLSFAILFGWVIYVKMVKMRLNKL